MIDRDSPVTEDELHAYVDGELPADRKEAVATWLATHPEQAALVASWRAQAESVRARYGAISRRAGAGAAQARPGHQQRTRQRAFLGCDGRGRGHCGFCRRRRRRLDGARSVRRRPDRVRNHRRRRARRLQALRGRGAPSGRSAGQRTRAHDAMAVEAARRGLAHSRSAVDRAEACRRPAASRPDRRRGFLHV